MILERAVISLALLALLGIAYLMVRRWQVQRIGQTSGYGQRPALLYFRSDHCAPCVTQSRLLQQLPEQFTEQITIEQIDAEMERETAATFGIFTLPTILLLDRQGSIRHVNYGLTDAGKLARQVESVL